MPIRELTTTTLTQECIACGSLHTHELAALELGATLGDGARQHVAPDTIVLPPCAACGAGECLVRTWDAMPATHADTPHAHHRRVVNALAQHLRARGQSAAGVKALHDREPAPPPDLAPALSATPHVIASLRPPTKPLTGDKP